MKKKTVKRFLAVMFAAALCAGTLTGCGGDEEPVPEYEEEDEYYEDEDLEEEDFGDENYEEEGLKDESEDESLNSDSDTSKASGGIADKVSKSKGKSGGNLNFTTTDIDGNKITGNDLFSKHEITMVNIWATWCGPCVGELSELNELNKRLEKKDCAVVGLVGDGEDEDTVAEAIQILDECGVKYTNILPWDGALDKDFVVDEGWPTTYFVDRDGNLVGEPVVGADINAYEETIDSLLGR